VIVFIFHDGDFEYSQILLAVVVPEGEMHYRAKFRQNLSIHCGVIAIFQFLKMAATTILDL